MITILFLSANPEKTDKLALIKECNAINKEIELAAGRESFKIEQYHDISIDQIRIQLLEYKPQIIHFSGHGSPRSALVFQTATGQVDIVPPDALTGLFKILGKDISLVFLNACYSQEQAEEIAKHVKCVIGMSRAISDETALKFAVSFYSTLGFGKSVKDAFDLAANDLKLFGIPDDATPQLCIKEGVDPSKLTYKDIEKCDRSRSNGIDLCQQLDKIKEQLNGVHMNEITIEEYFKFISPVVRDFCNNKKNKDKFGEIKINSLNLLMINFGITVKEIKESISISDTDKAKIKTIMATNTAVKINEIIDEICEKDG